MNDKSVNNQVNNINLSEIFSIIHFLDLNVVELLILELFIKYTDPIVRFNLFNEVDEFLNTFKKRSDTISDPSLSNVERKLVNHINEIEAKKQIIAPSSFYNSLKKLEKRGFIKFNYNPQGKIETIETTELPIILIEKLGQHFVNFLGASNDFKYVENLIEFLQQKLAIKSIKSLLIIWIPFLFDTRIINSLKSISDKCFLLSRIQSKQELEEKGLCDIKITKTLEKTLREPSEIFDIIGIPYYMNGAIKELALVDILKEAYRTLKNDGMLIALIDRPIPKINHNTMNRIGIMYNNANSNSVFTKHQIKDHMKEAQIPNYNFIEYERQLILVAKKS